MIKSTFTTLEADRILNIPLGANGLVDRFRWYAEKSGDYTVWSDYRLLLCGISGPDTYAYKHMLLERQTFYKYLWKTKAPEKMKITI